VIGFDRLSRKERWWAREGLERGYDEDKMYGVREMIEHMK
jgi:hypothetical protein